MTKPSEWTPADGLKLEPNALRVATERQVSFAVTAGPGAGKTEMLAQRADFLLGTGECPYPQRILAISFKVDASRNLKERVRRRCGYALASRFDSHTFHAFAKRLIDRFRIELPDEDALDSDYTVGPQRVEHSQITFDDLVPLGTQILLRCDVVLNALRQTYSHVFLDEFQDCTKTQYKLIKAAFLGTDVLFTAVGDTKQRIMGWAGALEGIFSTVAKDFGAEGLNLYQNFRSQPRLRRMQNEMVKVMEPAAAVPDDELVGGGGEVRVLKPFEDSFDEAVGIVDLIETWVKEEDLAPSEIAVLVGKQPEQYAEHLMNELASRGIAFRNEQDVQDLAVEPVARLIVDYLTVLFGTREPDAYMKVMDVLTGPLGLEDGDVRDRWQHFIDQERATLKSSAKCVEHSIVEQVTQRLIDAVGMPKLRTLSSDYEHGDYLQSKIDETLKRIEDTSSVEPDLLKALARFSDDRAVRIFNVHKCKGLEFDSVIFMAIEKEAFWGKIADERSVFFVGISRARRRLVLTWSKFRPEPSAPAKYWVTCRTPQEEFLSYAEL